jgi:hypothetical protein
MSEVKNVKIQNIIESQIPEFINSESPLFLEFLNQYYASLEYETGPIDLAVNFNDYKKIDHFSNSTFYSKNNPCTLTSEIFYFSDTIEVNSTKGFPKKLGLIKIDDEIITYTDTTETSFIGCIRGFSGIQNSGSDEYLSFSTTSASNHSENSGVKNLSLDFFEILFKKFKIQFLPGFEDRDFAQNIQLTNILFKARDFYTSKGTSVSFKILFDILYSQNVDVNYPIDYTLSPSNSEYVITKNILVEQIIRNAQSKVLSSALIEKLKGKTIFQNTSDLQISASIFNVEYRPFDGLDLFEISLDSESINAEFISTKKTKILEDVSVGDSIITVDSTVGFNNSGSLLIKTDNLTFPLEIPYESKTLGQFTEVSGLVDTVKYGSDVIENNLLSIIDDDGTVFEFRLINIIETIDLEKSSNLRVNDKISLSSFGSNQNDKLKFNTWIYNNPINHLIEEITSDNVYLRIRLYNQSVKFIPDEQLLLINSNDPSETAIATVLNTFESLQGVYVQTNFIAEYQRYDLVRKIISKGNSKNQYFSDVDKIVSGVRNTYIDYDEKNVFIASSGIPNYEFSATDNKIYVYTDSPETDIIYSPNHNYLTGEKVFYVSGYTAEQQQTRIKSSAYFVYKIDDEKIKLSLSHSDIIAEKFINCTEIVENGNDYLVKFGYENRTVKNQKTFKKINLEELKISSASKTTNDRTIGMFLNGVEINSPTLYDENIYYGKIESLIVDGKGSGYDVINFNGLEILDSEGTGASATAHIVGEVSEIKVISPGVGYQTKPNITISGGNGEGAVLEPNLVKTNIISQFKGDLTGLDFDEETITFIGKHNFDNGEEVIYDSNSNVNIQPFITNSRYFVRKISDTKIALHSTRNDALNNANTIVLASVSTGVHLLKSANVKNTITRVYVKNKGKGYSNAKITIPSSLTINNKDNGVNTFENYILAKNHGFKTGDIVYYETSNYAISGLSTTNSYCVQVIDSNKFKLAECGIGTESTTINLERKKYINLSGIGTGTHTFKYPPIEIKIDSLSEIESSELLIPTLKPVVLGSIENIFLDTEGSNYGTSEIINFHRRPDIRVKEIPSEALLKPVIFNGVIIAVQILNKGRGYGEDLDLIISGDGKYAELDPVIVNGRFQDVNVINGGVGYGEKTQIIIRRRGSGAKLIANITEWKINQVEKNNRYFNQIEDGFIIPSKDESLGLKYINFYSPKKLRYLLSDNISASGQEISPTSTNIRPYVILGWAYDGNPIFEPYAKFESTIRKVNSSYRILNEEEKNTLDLNNLRPKSSSFPVGFFIQDYIFDKKTTNGDLDENNGMYINDSGLPGISYGYFTTIDDGLTALPVYPYIIGKEFKNFGNPENFEVSFNQDTDLSKLNLIRNIGPYYIDSFGSSYEEVDKVDEKIKQDFIVKSIKSSSIDKIVVYDPGIDYKVGDSIIFDNKDTGGNGASAEIFKLKGKTISNFSVGVSTFKNSYISQQGNNIKVNTKIPHNLSSNEEVLIKSISDSNKKKFEGFKNIFVSQKSTNLLEDVAPQSTTGQYTSISVSDVSGFEVDNFIQINSETLKILRISEKESKLYVNRSSGTATTHFSSNSSVILLPNTFYIKNEDYNINYKENVNTYFDPSTSVGLGTSGTEYYKNIPVLKAIGNLDGTNVNTRKYIGITTGVIKVGDFVYGDSISAGTKVVSVGIGSIEVNPIVNFNFGEESQVIRIEREIYDKFVPSRAIFIENHNFRTGQELIYSIGIGGTGLYVYDDVNSFGPFQLEDEQKIYAVNLGTNLLGISTLGFTTSSGIGTQFNSLIIQSPNTTIGYSHSLRTAYPELTGKVESYFINVSTEGSHGLQTFDKVDLNVTTNKTKSITLRYDLLLRKITTDLIEFDSSQINTSTNEIPLIYEDLNTGDKIVYYDNNNPFNGLTNNQIYYVLRENSEAIKLCETQYDSSIGIAKSLPNVGLGTQYFALVSPPIILSDGDIINITLDESLYKIDDTLNFDFKLFYDKEFKYEVEKYKYPEENGIVIIDTTKYNFGSELYYNLIPTDSTIDADFTILDSDAEVIGSNKIKIEKNLLNSNFAVISTGSTSFKINLKIKPDVQAYDSDYNLDFVSYKTNSKNTLGPIDSIRINYGGLNYKKIPKIVSIASTLGKGAIIRPESSKIGRIEQLERIKDGFDYPSDFTLKPILSVPSVVNIKDIARVDYVGIITGGSGYLRPPSLRVVGNSNIKLQAEIDGGVVSNVNIVENVSNLSQPLEIVTLRNSNGIEIDFIEVDGTNVTLELINSDVVLFPYITTGVGSTISIFPFEVGDKIFVENCRKANIAENTDSFNSQDYDYSFFTITAVDEDNFTITYDMSEVKPNFNGNLLSGESNYTTDFGYGYVTNKKNMPVFEMNIIDDLSYISAENVRSSDFRGVVMDNGWDNDVNQLRIKDAKGTLRQGEKLFGETSLLNGTVESFSTFNLAATVGTSRRKINDNIKDSGILNDYQQRLSDNDYYQKFSYALKSTVPYSIWKEPVLSLAHPSGFKEFSELDIYSVPSNDLKLETIEPDLSLVINIDNYSSMYERHNFTMVSEDEENYYDGSIERVNLGAERANVSGIGITGPILGIALRPYILNKTNKVLQVDDIDSQFDGSNEYKSLGNKIIEVKTLEPFQVGISTLNIEIGDYIGLSTYLQPNSIVLGISTNKVTLNKPHKLSPYYGPIATVGVNTTVDNSGAYPYEDTFDSTIFRFDFTSFTFDSQ